jgi:hypothetical protein
MKDETFRDFLNLYLDGELSAEEESRLAELIARDAELRAEFLEACRLHGATQVVLNPRALQPKDLNERYFWSRLFMGFAAASCAVLGAMFLMPCVIQDEVAHISVPLSFKDPVLDADFYERAAREQALEKESKKMTACLAAHLRLQGLDPAVAPSGQPLEDLDARDYEPVRPLLLSEVNLEAEVSALNSNNFSLLKNKERFKELKLSILRPEMRRIQDVGFSGSLVRY